MLTFPVGFDESGAVHAACRVTGVPRTALIDRHGRIVAYGVGLPGGRKVMEQARALLVGKVDVWFPGGADDVRSPDEAASPGPGARLQRNQDCRGGEAATEREALPWHRRAESLVDYRTTGRRRDHAAITPAPARARPRSNSSLRNVRSPVLWMRASTSSMSATAILSTCAMVAALSS